MAGRPSGFKTEAARAAFYAMYDEAIARSAVPVDESAVATSFGTTHVLTAGDRSKPPLIALHALNFSSTMWLPLLPALTASHHVRLLDTVGGTNRSVATGITTSARHVVAWMDEVTDALDVDHAPLVSASFGGWMAMHYCLARPHRVARLAMLAPAGIVGSFRIKWMLTNFVKTQISPNMTKAQWMLDNLVIEGTRPKLRSDPWRPIAEQFIFGMPNFRRSLREPLPGLQCDIAPLAASGIPVLALIPRNETGHDGPKMARRYRQRLPHAQVELVDDSNHLIFIDQTDVVADRLQTFLSAA
jgi:pimeloyl-ACP methyl ester carboxylesterase